MAKKRTGYKHGDWVQEPVPHADIKKYVERGTRKEDTRGKRVRKEGSTMKMGSKQRRRAQEDRPRGGWTA
jgi:hypothetical protein